jgi:hypothetical protein
MIDKANIRLQHPSGMIQVDGRWAMPVTTQDGLPTGAYRWAAADELPQTTDPRAKIDAGGQRHSRLKPRGEEDEVELSLIEKIVLKLRCGLRGSPYEAWLEREPTILHFPVPSSWIG